MTAGGAMLRAGVAMGGVPGRGAGAFAEEDAARYLQERGYEIRARNFFCRWGEVDVVAERAGTICFVEVRMRSRDLFGDPAETISARKRRRIVRAALHFLFANDLRDKAIRFDVISVVGQGGARKIEHIPDAFDAGM